MKWCETKSFRGSRRSKDVQEGIGTELKSRAGSDMSGGGGLPRRGAWRGLNGLRIRDFHGLVSG